MVVRASGFDRAVLRGAGDGQRAAVCMAAIAAGGPPWMMPSSARCWPRCCASACRCRAVRDGGGVVRALGRGGSGAQRARCCSRPSPPATAVTQFMAAWGCSPRLASPASSRSCMASPPSRHRGDQIVSGVAINMIAAGLTVVLASPGSSRRGDADAGARGAAHRLAAVLSASRVQAVVRVGGRPRPTQPQRARGTSPSRLSRRCGSSWSTRPGLRLRAVGENPAMVGCRRCLGAGSAWR